jgi:hypothetical protein
VVVAAGCSAQKDAEVAFATLLCSVFRAKYSLTGRGGTLPNFAFPNKVI